MSEKQRQLERVYVEQKMTESNIALLRQQIDLVEAVLRDYRTGLHVLAEMESKEDGETVLMHVGGRIFVRAKLVSPHMVTRGIGSNIRIEQSIEDAKKGVQDAITRLEKQKEALTKEYNKHVAYMAALNAQLQNIAAEMHEQGEK